MWSYLWNRATRSMIRARVSRFFHMCRHVFRWPPEPYCAFTMSDPKLGITYVVACECGKEWK